METETGPNRRWWYALGVFIALGNFVLAIIALLNADLFLFLMGICVGIFVAVPLVQVLREYRGVPR